MNELDCIICCVNYSDILSHTLYNNIKYLNNIIIITTPKDTDTIKLCEKYNVKCLTTNLFYEKSIVKFNWKKVLNFCWWSKYLDNFNNKPCFNKAKAINYALRYSKKNWILLLDADIILPNNISSMDLNTLSKEALYSTNRYVYENKNDYDNKKNGYLDHWQFVGFFQLFNKTSKNFRKNYYGYDEQCNYADESDLTFMRKWHEKKLLNFDVIHLGKTCVNWKGRITESWEN